MQTPPDSDPTADAKLARQVEQGNDLAFRTLMERHLQPLRSFLALRAPVPDLIDEVAHDAFVFAYQNLGDFTHGSMQPDSTGKTSSKLARMTSS